VVQGYFVKHRFVPALIIVSLFLLSLTPSCASKKPVLYENGEPLSITDYEKIAQKEFDQGRYSNAIEVYQAIITHYPENTKALAWAHYEIAYCHFMKDDYEQARKYFRIVANEYREPAATTLAEQMLDRLIELENQKSKKKKKK
jgi:outer membrane protein assembly factor BamD (BamD/ComL family)